MNADLKARVEARLVMCGPHDYGVPAGCSCPEPGFDYRPILSELLAEAEQLHERNDEQAAAIAELDRANAYYAGRLQTVEEQLAAATLQEGGQ